MERRGGLLDLRRCRRALLTLPPTLACVIVVTGCDEPRTPRGTELVVRQAITGGQNYVDESNEDAASLNGCTPFDRSVIRQAGLYMRTVSGFTDYFSDCLRDSVLHGAPFTLGGTIGPYVACPSDPLANSPGDDQLQQALVARLLPSSMTVGCGYANGGGGVTEPADIGSWGKSGPERFELSQTQIDQATAELQLSEGTQTIELIAGLMLHEAYHNHGYLHEPPGRCPGQQMGTNDMPSIVQMCIQKAGTDRFVRSSASCAGECRAGGHLVIPKSFEERDGSCACERELGAMRPDPDVEDPPQRTDFENASTDAAGTVIASGNFDGDFYDDLAVAVPGEQKIEIYYGTVWGLVRLRDLTEDPLDQAPSEDEFGAALAVADFDDDGFDDLAVGAPGKNGGEGRVYVYRGSLRGMVPGQTLSAFDGPHAGDRFGAALAAGFDGDKRAPDRRFDRFLAVGAPRRSTREATSGAVYVFVDRGGQEFADPRLLPFSEVAPPVADATSGADFGAALATGTRLAIDPPSTDPNAVMATDVSVVIGAPGLSNDRGRAYLYDGHQMACNDSPPPSATMRMDGLPDGARFGSALAVGPFGTLGPKVFVGSPGAGRVDRFDAGTNEKSPGTHEGTIFGPPGRRFGASLAGLEPSGNLGGLLFVGAPGDDGTAPLGGLVSVYGTEGPETVELDRLTQALMSESQVGDRFGASIALGNFDHDAGNLAVAVGAPGDFPSPVLDAKGSGAVFTFKQHDSCQKFLGWKTHTDSGRIWDTVSPFIPAKHRAVDGVYRAGDRVTSECDVFQALVDAPGSDLTDTSTWESLNLAGGGIAPTARPRTSSIECTSDDGAEVVFDATASYDLDNPIVDYAWSTSAGSVAHGARATATLPPGDNIVVLTVTDESRIESSARLVVTVDCRRRSTRNNATTAPANVPGVSGAPPKATAHPPVASTARQSD